MSILFWFLVSVIGVVGLASVSFLLVFCVAWVLDTLEERGYIE